MAGEGMRSCPGITTEDFGRGRRQGQNWLRKGLGSRRLRGFLHPTGSLRGRGCPSVQGIPCDPQGIPTSPCTGQTSLPTRLGHARPRNQAERTEPEGIPPRPWGSTRILQGRKLRIWENPVIPKLRVLWCSAALSACQENPFSSRKRIWASPSQADPHLCKTISFSRWKFMAVLAKNVEREGIQGLLLKLVIIFGDLPSPCSGRSRGAEPVGAAPGPRPLCATSSSVKL